MPVLPAPIQQQSGGAQNLRYEDELVVAWINRDWWPKNPGHVLIVPGSHIENIYVLPLREFDRVPRLAKQVALGLKETYGCDGVSTRQHNEPSGNQEVWHYHFHVFPRWMGDRLYFGRSRFASITDRIVYADCSAAVPRPSST